MATMAAAGGWPQEAAIAGARGRAHTPEQSEQTVGGWLAPPAGAPPDPQSFWDDDDDDCICDTWGANAAVQPSSAPPAHASTSSWAAPQTAADNSGWNANKDGWNAGWAQQSAEVDTQGWSLDPVQAPVTTKPPDHTSAFPAQSQELGSDWPEEAAASAPLAASSVEGPLHDAGEAPPGAAPP
jgi:hypothetical protein